MFPKFHGIQLALGASIVNAVVENVTSDPTLVGPARIWYNGVSKKLKFSSLDAGGAVVVQTVASGDDVQEALDAIAALGARVDAIELNYVKKDGSVAFTGNIDAGSNKLVNVANGTQTTDGVNYGQLQSAIASLANAFKYIAKVAGGDDAGTAKDLTTLPTTVAGSYYKVDPAGYFKVGSAGDAFFANKNDGLVFNPDGGVDIVDNTNSTVAGTPTFITVNGSADTGYTVDIAAEFKARVVALESGLAAEILRAEGAESDLSDAIGAETSRATTAEGVLNTAITSEASTARAAESALSAKIGDISTLETTAKGDVVSAINELANGGSAADGKIGDLSTLTTDAKDTLVNAINEVDANANAAAAAAAAEATRAQGVEGDLSTLPTDAKGSLVAAIAEVDSHADAATAAVAAEVTRATGVEVGLRTDVDAANSGLAAEVTRAKGVEGTLSSLTTDTQTSLVGAVNEVDAHIDAEVTRAKAAEGSLPLLNTTTKTDLVSAVNEVNTAVGAEATRASGVEAGLRTDVDAAAAAVAAEAARAQGVEGNLSGLVTTDKSDLVSAINEVATAAGEGTGALKDAINAKKFKQTAGAAALVHTFTHNLNSDSLHWTITVQGDDSKFRNDIVTVEETSANVLTVTLTESRIVKAVITDESDLA